MGKTAKAVRGKAERVAEGGIGDAHLDEPRDRVRGCSGLALSFEV